MFLFVFFLSQLDIQYGYYIEAVGESVLKGFFSVWNQLKQDYLAYTSLSFAVGF